MECRPLLIGCAAKASTLQRAALSPNAFPFLEARIVSGASRVGVVQLRDASGWARLRIKIVAFKVSRSCAMGRGFFSSGYIKL